MAWSFSFFNGARKKRSQMIAVDLGSRTTKAVLIERRGEVLALTRYALLDAPVFEKKISTEALAEHLHAVSNALGNVTKSVTVAVGLEDTMVRQIELPQIPISAMREVLKMNHKNYLQQDLPNHVFDCYIIPPRNLAATGAIPKLKVLAVAPGLIGPINTFELALPEIFANDSVALVDIGFKHTSVCLIDRGELVLNRVFNMGGDKLTAGLAESMNISYAEAEGIKVGMAPEVESALQMQVIPLGREIRASLDFYEHQHDRRISQVFVSGGTAQPGFYNWHCPVNRRWKSNTSGRN
jgi:Tfp pilus assembly PilM family ATPase